MEKLDREELMILDALSPETGTIEKIEEKTKIEKCRIEKMLEKLEKLKFVSRMETGENDSIDFWSTTRNGESCLGENVFKNEFGEFFTREEIKEINDRVLRLPDKFIDELFFRCGFIYTPHTMKALSEEALEEIRKEKSVRFSLLEETPKKEVLENLEKTEKEAKNQNQTSS